MIFRRIERPQSGRKRGDYWCLDIHNKHIRRHPSTGGRSKKCIKGLTMLGTVPSTEVNPHVPPHNLVEFTTSDLPRHHCQQTGHGAVGFMKVDASISHNPVPVSEVCLLFNNNLLCFAHIHIHSMLAAHHYRSSTVVGLISNLGGSQDTKVYRSFGKTAVRVCGWVEITIVLILGVVGCESREEMVWLLMMIDDQGQFSVNFRNISSHLPCRFELLYSMTEGTRVYIQGIPGHAIDAASVYWSGI